jgi:hypothetical protein
VIDAPAEPAPQPELPRVELPHHDLPREVASPPLGNVNAENGGPPPSASAAPRATPIIPLAQVPDDPGPEPEGDTDGEVATAPKADAWQRIRQLFR